MELYSGKLFKNKTWKYLYPVLKFYGKDLDDYLTSFIKIAIGIGDINTNFDNDNIFILFDLELKNNMQINLKKYREKFQLFLNYIKIQHYYTADYPYKYDKFSTGHMVVLKVPFKHREAFFSFIKGKYSSMYILEDVNRFFQKRVFQNKEKEKSVNKFIKSSRDVLLKDSSRKKYFIKKVNQDFDTNIKEDMFNDDFELDYPPKLSEEIFGYIPKKGDYWN